MSSPTIGRLVHYTLSNDDADAINRRRNDFFNRGHRRDEPSGFQAHVGNPVGAGDVFPALVVRVFNETCVNLQVSLDGNDSFWATSRCEGPAMGQWKWPERV